MKKVILIFTYSNILFLFVFLFLSSPEVNSQPTIEWVQRYNSFGNQDDNASDMVVDKYGNVYVTGYIKISNTNYDFITLKYFSNGNLHWAKTFDANQGDDRGLFIGIDNSGNVYVTGKSNYYTNSTTFLTIKYSNNGDELWVRSYTNDNNYPSISEAMVVDDSGNVYVTGYCIVSGNNADYTTLKYNTNGDILWVRFLNGSSNSADIPYAITIDKNQNVYITGQGREVPGITIVNKSVKYDKFGNQKWVADYFGLGTVAEIGLKICVDDSGFVYVGGYGLGEGQSQNDYRLLKYDSSGILKWMRYYNNGTTNPNDYLRDMTLDKNGKIYVTGSSATSQLGWDYLTIKYNSNGDSSWIRRYNPVQGSDDVVNSITVDKNGNVYLTGYSDRAYLGYNYATVKYNSSGVQQWNLIYNNNSLFYNHYGVKVALDSSGNIYVTGYSQAAGTGYDITTIKYSSPSGINNINSQIPKEYKLYQNYPNPFNPSTKIKFDIPRWRSQNRRDGGIKRVENGTQNISIKVFDLLGREIESLVNEKLQPGTYEINFNGSYLASGIYFSIFI